MQQFNVHEAKTNFSKLLIRVSLGEEIIIARDHQPLARLVPFETKKFQRKPGRWKGKIIMADDFTDPLPPHVMKYFT